MKSSTSRNLRGFNPVSPNTHQESAGLQPQQRFSPRAFNGEKAPYWLVIAHELIHVVLKNPDDPHDSRFDAMAEAMRIPERYRD